MRKYFTKNTPEMRGRIKVTVETDMVVMREFWQLVGDIPSMISERAPQVVQAYKDFQKAWDELERSDEMQPRPKS